MLGLKRGPLTMLAVLLASAGATSAAEAQDPPDYGPDVLVISEPVLAALEKGLRTEIALRAALKKEMAAQAASVKTPAQYWQCQGEAAMSPEIMKIAEAILSIPDDATAGQRQRRMERIGRRFEAVVLKKCGPEPRRSDESQLAARLQEIEIRAANAAGPLP